MSDLNLSQSMTQKQEETRTTLFDRGFLVVFGIFFLTLIVWGGLRLYLYSLEKQNTSLDGILTERSTQLRGSVVNRVVDFDTRQTFVSQEMDAIVDPSDLFRQVEGLMVPAVSLTQYEYNKEEKVVTFGGTTSNFRHIAEQILGLKSEKMFENIVVDTIGRDKDGQLIFTLKAHF